MTKAKVLGWHTGAMTMRLLVESEFRIAGAIVGTGFDEFRWTRPAYLGDALTLKPKWSRFDHQDRTRIGASSR